MVTNYNSNRRRQSPLTLVAISTGLFLLAVVFSLVGGLGFYVSIALVIMGCFSTIVLGIVREASLKPGVLQARKESEDF